MRDLSKARGTRSRLRLRSSHRRTGFLRISHSRPGTWVPPNKDLEEDEDLILPRKGKKHRR